MRISIETKRSFNKPSSWSWDINFSFPVAAQQETSNQKQILESWEKAFVHENLVISSFSKKFFLGMSGFIDPNVHSELGGDAELKVYMKISGDGVINFEDFEEL